MKRKLAVAMLAAMFLLSSSTFFAIRSIALDGYELLIIAPSEFMDALQPLRDFKDVTDSARDLTAILQSDEDGFYSYLHKHKGKPEYYTVQIETTSGYIESKQVLLKANKFVAVNFQIL